ncbi:TolC family protein, partial [Gemmatimonadota bacterium]
FSFNQMDMTMKALSVTQMFPAPGVRDARTTLSERAVDVSEQEIAMTRESLSRRARLLYLDLHDIEQALVIVSENQALLETFIRISEARYRTGGGIQQDILKARLEHSRLTEKAIHLEAGRESARSTMNLLRGRPAGEEFELVGLPQPGAPLPAAEDLFSMAQVNNPVLRKASAMVAQSEAATALAERSTRPAWSAATSYSQRDGGRKDLLSASVMVQVPFWTGRKQARAVDEREALTRETLYRQQEMELGILDSIYRLQSRFEESRRLIGLYASEIIPESEGVLNSALAGYQVGQVNFLTLLSAQATLFNYQLESIRVMTDYHRHLIEMEAVLGTAIPGTGIDELSGNRS